MKLCKDEVTDTLANFVYESSGLPDGYHAGVARVKVEKSRLTALPDDEILALYYTSDDWYRALADGYTVEMVDGLTDEGKGDTYNIDEVNVIIQIEQDYGINVFSQPYNKFTKKMVSNDQGGDIAGFGALDDISDGSAEWMICFDDQEQLDTIKQILTSLGANFVVRDMEADNINDFGDMP